MRKSAHDYGPHIGYYSVRSNIETLGENAGASVPGTERYRHRAGVTAGETALEVEWFTWIRRRTC